MEARIDAALPVRAVTLHEDRAHVRREGVATLPAGRVTLVVARVAPVIVDKTLQVQVDGAELVDVSVRRRRVPRGQGDALVRDLRREIRTAWSALQLLTAQLELVRGERTHLQRVAGLALQELSEDGSWGRMDAQAWAARLAAVETAEANCGVTLVELKRDLEEARERLQDLRRRERAAQHPGADEVADLHIALAVAQPGETRVQVGYLVPCALWRPWHTATLEGGTVAIATDGCVWQNTGEDWEEVALSFSTERPSLGVSPPLLDTDLLRVREVGKQVRVGRREQRVEEAGMGGGRAEADEVPGIDDGGDPLLLRAATAASVPSHGRPVRVPICQMQAEADLALVLAAELQPAVILRSVQVHSGDHPLLAGPVDLVRAGGRAGRTRLDFIAPGERFELGWGPEFSLRVTRSQTEGKPKQRTLSSWTSTVHTATVRLSNIGPDTRTIQVRERVPVSEHEKVKVEVDRDATSDKAAPDKDGFVQWQVVLPGHGTAERVLSYALRKHDDVSGI